NSVLLKSYYSVLVSPDSSLRGDSQFIFVTKDVQGNWISFPADRQILRNVKVDEDE
ncbi:MAG: hypothetical protein GX444_09770, partial [Myxococcales bacterium]|nr:hypothetical protein [Myxococcales bacterium]